MRPFLLLLLAFCPSLLSLAQSSMQSDKALTDLTLSRPKIESHLAFLASDELRGRNTPSPEQAIAARYLITQLSSYGVKPLPEYPDYLQPVPMVQESKPSTVLVRYGGKSFAFIEQTLLFKGQNATLEAEAVFVGFGTADDFKATDVKGKIVISRCGDGKSTNPQAWYGQGEEKRKRASEKGALALIELYTNPQLPWKILASYFSGGNRPSLDDAGSGDAFAHLWLHDTEGKEASSWADGKKMKVNLTIAGIVANKFTAYNVVGYVEGRDEKLKNEYLVCSAHYDHIGIGKPDAAGDSIYNGARDNAVGTVTVLAAAENIGRSPTRRSVLFVLFTAEEKGLLGSKWFVEHSPIALKKLVYCFNSDNGGYNDTSILTLIGLERTTAAPLIKEAAQAYGLKATDDPAPEQNLFDRSDNVSFAKKGIPAPTFSLGFKAFDEQINKYYHQAADSPQSLDYAYLTRFFGAYILSSRLIANADRAPFWTTGDKYYDTGLKLYK